MDRCSKCDGEIVWEDAYSIGGGSDIIKAGYRCAACGHAVCAMCGRREIEVNDLYCLPCSKRLNIESYVSIS